MRESEVAQSCRTLSDPMDCSLPSSSVHGIFQAEYWSGVPLNSELSFFVLSHVQLFATSWTVAHQTPLSMGFPRQEYWSRSPCLPPGDLPDPGDLLDPGIKPMSPVTPALAGRFFYHCAIWEV